MKALSNINIVQLFLSLICLDISRASYFRSNSADNFYEDDEFKVRQLDWNFIGKIFNDDEFFSDYDKNEIPSSVSGKGKEGDRDDYLRNDDKCAGSDGSISKSNCRTPPRCNKETSSLGKQKLCINRSFEPDKRNSWYVVAMKCIPEWENCDKCFCGYMKESYAKTGYCKFDDSSVNDDRVDVNCDKIERIKIMGRSYNYETQSSDSDSKSKQDKKKKKSSDIDSKSKQDKKKKKSSDSDSDSKKDKKKKKKSSSDSDSKSKKDRKKEKSSDSDSKKNKKNKKSDSDSKSKKDRKKKSSSSDSKSKKNKKNKGKK